LKHTKKGGRTRSGLGFSFPPRASRDHASNPFCYKFELARNLKHTKKDGRTRSGLGFSFLPRASRCQSEILQGNPAIVVHRNYLAITLINHHFPILRRAYTQRSPSLFDFQTSSRWKELSSFRGSGFSFPPRTSRDHPDFDRGYLIYIKTDIRCKLVC